MFLKTVLPVLLILTPVAAIAECGAGQEAFLSCTLSEGKRALDVCLAGETLSYAFGKVGKTPDLTLLAPVTDVGYLPWNGIGRAISEEVSFTNADVTYSVWSAVDRLEDDHPLSGGVVVLRQGQMLANLGCDKGSVTLGQEILFERLETLGQCWDLDQRHWQPCN